LITSNNSVYEGTWVKSKMNGKGYSRSTLTGKGYWGPFKKDRPHGLGLEIHLDGTIYKGNFEKGEYD